MKRLALAALLFSSLTTFAADATPEKGVDEVLSRIAAGFDRADGKAVASNWTEDGTLITPVGAIGVGRANVERLAIIDAETLLKGAQNTLKRDRLRKVSDTAVLVDATHTVTGEKNMLLHVVLLMVKVQGAWKVADARPYLFPTTESPDTTANR